MKEVIIIENNLSFDIHEESGQAIEFDFDSYESANQFAKDQNWKVVEKFFVK